jgi:hypothetical protein
MTRRSSTCRCFDCCCCLRSCCRRCTSRSRGLLLRSLSVLTGFLQVRRFFCLGLRSNSELELELELELWRRRRLFDELELEFEFEFEVEAEVRDLVAIRLISGLGAWAAISVLDWSSLEFELELERAERVRILEGPGDSFEDISTLLPRFGTPLT